MYKKYAEKGTLPADFDQWELADKDGWTVAHQAAYYGHLHGTSDLWGLADKDGWTVAHVAAHQGHLPTDLPADFAYWGSVTVLSGKTVAHMAVRKGYLPVDFNQWDLADSDGWTVAHEAADCEHLPVNIPVDFAYWGLVDHNGQTVAQLAPEVYKQWQVLRALDSTCSDMPDTQNSQMI
jgi:hypothetical protein